MFEKDDSMKKATDISDLTDIKYKPKRAYCKMQANPKYPTTNPYGYY